MVSNLLRAEYERGNKIYRGHHTHLSDSSTNKPLCGILSRIAIGDSTPGRWLVIQGEKPTCPDCDRIARKRMQKGGAA